MVLFLFFLPIRYVLSVAQLENFLHNSCSNFYLNLDVSSKYNNNKEHDRQHATSSSVSALLIVRLELIRY